ncbi:MAG: hypothetical protein FP826_07110 [Sphingomonadales bacterium]|nr:hypothetical protein [Sphingomonadales bacterium]MBU3992931.1 hypothetical protein [Alphaproteobacteria bacterium]
MAIFRKAAARGQKKPELPATPPEQEAADPAGAPAEPPAGHGAHPLAKLILGGIALRGGDTLLRRVVDRGLLGPEPASSAANKTGKVRSVAQALIGTAIVRVATRSVPGAIVVGGGLLAKALYDRKRNRPAAADLRRKKPQSERTDD